MATYFDNDRSRVSLPKRNGVARAIVFALRQAEIGTIVAEENPSEYTFFD